jgi:hypothetical protein
MARLKGVFSLQDMPSVVAASNGVAGGSGHLLTAPPPPPDGGCSPVLVHCHSGRCDNNVQLPRLP